MSIIRKHTVSVPTTKDFSNKYKTCICTLRKIQDEVIKELQKKSTSIQHYSDDVKTNSNLIDNDYINRLKLLFIFKLAEQLLEEVDNLYSSLLDAGDCIKENELEDNLSSIIDKIHDLKLSEIVFDDVTGFIRLYISIVNTFGVQYDFPVLNGSYQDYVEIIKQNGLTTYIKETVDRAKIPNKSNISGLP
ncbi:MAG: hypothetical protein K6A41_04615 [Bacteroidales bacterium]|nr:hypothetical protein [Bacteroidales bacterium]